MDLYACARRRLSALLGTAAGTRCALLLDEDTLRVLSAGMRMSDLLEEAPHVTVIESVHAEHNDHAPPPHVELLDLGRRRRARR